MKPRRSFEPGHRRKFLLVVDDSRESETALYYAASRCQRSSASLALLYVIEPGDAQYWAGVRQAQIEEETVKAKALFRMLRRKLHLAAFDDVDVEDVLLEGERADAILHCIADDEDIAILVLGASSDAKGPGPLVQSLAAGKHAGGFPVPITIVPGHLTLETIKALA